MNLAKITWNRVRWLLPAGTVLTLGIGLAGGPAQAAPRVSAPVGTINTVAGGVGGPGPATSVALMPCGVSLHRGSIYVADDVSVRKISQTGQLTTPAGTGTGAGPAFNGGLATQSGLTTCGVTTDHAGNLLIADGVHHQVGVMAAKSGTFYGQAMTAGHVYAVAGNGQLGYSTSGVPAKTAKLGDPADVIVDGSGNLVIADAGQGIHNLGRWARVQVVAESSGTFYGQAMTAGDIYTVAGSGTLKGGQADGHPATQAAIALTVGQVTLDRAGNLLVAATLPVSRLWLVATTSGRFYGRAMTAGDIYTIAGTGGRGPLGDGGPAAQASVFPQGVAVDAAGNAVIGDEGNARVRVVAASNGTFYGQAMTTGDIYTIAGTGTRGVSGDGGPATAAEVNAPQGVAVDPATGDVTIVDFGNDSGIAGPGTVRVIAGASGTRYGQAMTAGDIYTVGGVVSDTDGHLFSGDGGPALRAELEAPCGVAVDQAGNTLITDVDNNRIRVTAAASGTFYGQPMTKGDIYTVAGNGTAGFSGDGGPATSAALNQPQDVALDHAGNLLIADDLRIRVVAVKNGTFYGQAMAAGDIYTVAGDGNFQRSGDGGPATSAGVDPDGVAVDAAGNLVIGDFVNDRVRVVAVSNGTFYGKAMTAGDIYTVAGNGNSGFSGDGGPATSAGFGLPRGVAVDAAGNLLVTDTFNDRIRVVAVKSGTFYGQAMTKGDIYTVAGDGHIGFSGDGGPATATSVYNPFTVTVDGAGNLVIADTGNSRIRVVAARTGTFYQQAMTKGDIYTVAGSSTEGFSGDGGPATGAALEGPEGVVVDGHGDLLISDGRRIRMITG